MVLASACALLCLLVRRLFMYLFVQCENRCRQLSISFHLHRLQSGEMSCLRMSCFGSVLGIAHSKFLVLV